MEREWTRGLVFAVTLVAGMPGVVLAQHPDLDPRIEKLVGAVSEERLTMILKKLETFGTRNTLSSTDSPTKGIGAARQWIFDQMKGFSQKLDVSFDTYKIARQGRITRDVEVRNIIAVLPGKNARRVYISGHYDTIAIEGGQSSNNARAPALAVSRSRSRPIPELPTTIPLRA